jgi:A118 family predicted phage portal protein
MITKFLDWVKEILKRLAGDGRTKSEGQVLLDKQAADDLSLWARMYEGKPPWVDNKKTHSAEIPAGIAYEVARLVTLEFESAITGSPRGEYLQAAYGHVLKALRVQVEYACVLGGIIFKPYVRGDHVEVDFIHADCFYPTAFNGNGKITGCVFVSTIRRNGIIYNRIESHNMEADGCRIINLAYASKSRESLGHEIALTEVPEWADIQPDAMIHNINAPLFAYFRIPQANRKNRNSPLGVSVFSKAVELIKQADEQYSRILWEFEGSELAIDAAESLFKSDASGKVTLPDRKDRLFRRHEIDQGIKEKAFIQTFSPEIRDSSLFNGFNRLLQRIEFNCGLAYGTISDIQVEAKTATEIKASKQRSYALVSDIQDALKDALEDLIWAMDTYATIYRLAPGGAYEVSYNFDDSLIVDSDTENMIALQEVSANILSKEQYLMKRYGVTKEQAREMMPKEQERLPMEE